jgi:hypothetical protein
LASLPSGRLNDMMVPIFPPGSFLADWRAFCPQSGREATALINSKALKARWF